MPKNTDILIKFDDSTKLHVCMNRECRYHSEYGYGCLLKDIIINEEGCCKEYNTYIEKKE